jgi:predicted alpha/beta-hydrolase family hydrolase
MATISNSGDLTSPRKIAALATCVAVICVAAILWQVYKEKAIHRRFAEDAARSRASTAKGDAIAQFNLGKIYAHGQGVPRDYAEAVRWYRKAADQGDAGAQYALGFMYRKGQGVPQDSAETARWYRKAAGQGDAHAQYALGHMYHNGQGVPQDSAEAIRWCRKAADQGDANAQYALGFTYHKGQVPQDDAEALRWYAKIAASCFAKTQERPLQRWISILVLVLVLPVLAVPKRRWGPATWVPSELLSATLAAALAHTLLLSDSSLTLLDRVLPGTLFSGFGRVLWLAFLAVGSATFAITAVVQAVRGSKRSRLL